jgi:hypothetical protein
MYILKASDSLKNWIPLKNGFLKQRSNWLTETFSFVTRSTARDTISFARIMKSTKSTSNRVTKDAVVALQKQYLELKKVYSILKNYNSIFAR